MPGSRVERPAEFDVVNVDQEELRPGEGPGG
jgi:hypothetical protein